MQAGASADGSPVKAEAALGAEGLDALSCVTTPRDDSRSHISCHLHEDASAQALRKERRIREAHDLAASELCFRPAISEASRRLARRRRAQSLASATSVSTASSHSASSPTATASVKQPSSGTSAPRSESVGARLFAWEVERKAKHEAALADRQRAQDEECPFAPEGSPARRQASRDDTSVAGVDSFLERQRGAPPHLALRPSAFLHGPAPCHPPLTRMGAAAARMRKAEVSKASVRGCTGANWEMGRPPLTAPMAPVLATDRRVRREGAGEGSGAAMRLYREEVQAALHRHGDMGASRV